ncbi:MAG: thiamine phosphate synthase [Beijerinckiaceae bacterium]|jgi:thiamine-phosphate pyrophosphorylase
MTDDSPGLYLFSPPLAQAGEFAAPLQEALAGGPVASVHLDLAGLGEGEGARVAAPFVALVQKAGAAALVGDVRTAGRAKADGVHVRASGEALEGALEEALQSMRPDRIVGAGLLRNRHDAMTAGEADVDYVAFGEPSADGWRPPLAETLERVGWWAEIFNVPCVAFAGSLEEAEALAAAGADFVALGAAVWDDPRGPRAAVAEALTRLAEAGRARSR